VTAATLPAETEVHVWSIHIGAGQAAALTEEERARARAFAAAERRRHFVAARGASRQILGAYLGRPPSDLTWCAGPNGKPYLALPPGGPELHFNVSHSGDLALLAVTSRRPLGVDVERVRTGHDVPAAARRFFPAAEVDGLHAAPPQRRGELYGRLWVRKEACVKAAGGRLGQGLALPVGTEPGTVAVRDSGAARLGGPWTVADLPVPAGYAAAVAVEGLDHFRHILLAFHGPQDLDTNLFVRR
jgi:4'-phosphopantetheinyl transferase